MIYLCLFKYLIVLNRMKLSSPLKHNIPIANMIEKPRFSQVNPLTAIKRTKADKPKPIAPAQWYFVISLTGAVSDWGLLNSLYET